MKKIRKKAVMDFLMGLFNTLVLSVLIVSLTGIPSIAAERVFFYHTDPVGSPLAITDDKGDVVWEADYMPFGVENEVVAGIKNKNRFVGKEKDEETDLYYFGARYLDARTGRFVKTDPLGISEPDLMNPQRFNRYAYGLNNPYKYVDPDGNTVWDVADIGFFGYSLYKFAENPSWSTGGDLALDTLGLLPLIPSIGSIRVVGKGLSKLDDAVDAAKASKKVGRTGKQAKLRELADDPKVSSADRGWIRNEKRHIERGNRKTIRLPGNSRESHQGGKVLAHKRGKRAKDGYGYEHSNLQDTDLHKLEHKHESY